MLKMLTNAFNNRCIIKSLGSSNNCSHVYMETENNSLAKIYSMAFVTPSFGGSVSATKNMYSTTHESHRGASSMLPNTPSRQWYRSYSNEYDRFFYWDSITNQSTWDTPPAQDIVIDYATQKQVPREDAVASQPTVLAQNVFMAADNSSSSLSG